MGAGHFNDDATLEMLKFYNPKNFFCENTELKFDKLEFNKTSFKGNTYLKLPLFLRAFLYFLYRYVIKIGFLDGKKGLIWHFLESFWYRFIVDAKIFEISKKINKEQNNVLEVIKQEYGVDLAQKAGCEVDIQA